MNKVSDLANMARSLVGFDEDAIIQMILDPMPPHAKMYLLRLQTLIKFCSCLAYRAVVRWWLSRRGGQWIYVDICERPFIVIPKIPGSECQSQPTVVIWLVPVKKIVRLDFREGLVWLDVMRIDFADNIFYPLHVTLVGQKEFLRVTQLLEKRFGTMLEPLNMNIFMFLVQVNNPSKPSQIWVRNCKKCTTMPYQK